MSGVVQQLPALIGVVIGALERFARGERTDTEQWDALMADVIADRARFYAEARRDLGITSGQLPSSGRWDADPISVTPTGLAT
ncbi:hypothetical protein EAS64_42225 [Trebonia kvetii]|uniref:Uncharacterized protein n=1 Tax=Trebonia kvetii TaxID=2480626 RepID=A0A6P2BN41_9ACTN|nr:hypothetical protein [Trebonia kvetii]TVY99059.1 hypothetical protein EAS64_42225 [Trebonia kvetii]